jgi:hypothetical protein
LQTRSGAITTGSASEMRPAVATRKSPKGIDMRIPVRDCMTEGRVNTHGWGACTSVEGTGAPSTGDTIERTIDSARHPWEKSSLGQKWFDFYFTSESLRSSPEA